MYMCVCGVEIGCVEEYDRVVSVVGIEHVCFFQAEDGIRNLVRSRGLGEVYKRQDYS